VAFNTEVEPGTVEAMSGVFTEVVVAPGFTRAAREDLAEREQLRLLQAWPNRPQDLDIRFLPGGALVQAPDAASEGRDDMDVVTTRQPTPDQWVDLLFAWKVASRVKSNAIVLAKDRATVGIGAGQMSRVDSVDIACWKAGDRARGSVMASDAFFPFRDGIEHAARFGVSAVIHPGGSVRDAEVLEAAQRHGMTMVLTGRRHFRH
jgi:phosphoribosylaminoimidazolecarboxamide formyltransferase/IMP cyclohydrolase